MRIVAGNIGSSAADIENAVYLCCLESILNAAKHAGRDARVTVRLRLDGASLAFTIRDTGPGFDPRVTPAGAGLTGVRDRIETVGGRVEISSAPGRGATVSGIVPWPPRTA